MKKLFARLSLTFILAILVVPFFVPRHASALLAGEFPAPTATIVTSADVASALGDPVKITTYLNGTFSNANLTYNLYISTGNPATEPVEPVTDSSVWADKSPDANSFALSEDQLATGLANYWLLDVDWQVSSTTFTGTHYVKAVITDDQRNVICQETTTIRVVSDGVMLTLTANGENTYLQYDKSTNASPIQIVAKMTSTSASTNYKGNLYITTNGYADQKDHATDASAWQTYPSYSFGSGTDPAPYTYNGWNPTANNSAIGNHQVMFKIYDNNNIPYAKEFMWVKICEGNNCGTTGATTGTTAGDTSKLNLAGAVKDAIGITDFTNYGDVVKFLKDKWFPTIVGMFAFLGIIYSAWLYIMSAGDQAKADKGKKGLVYSVIGIAIAVGANIIINVSNSVITTFNNSTNIVGGSDTIFTKATNMIAMISGMLAFLYLIYSGILYLTASGNPDNAKKGLQGVINAAIGIVIIVATWAIIGAVTGTLGAYFK